MLKSVLGPLGEKYKGYGAIVDMMPKGIENSQARIIALEGLCDEEVYQEEINHARAKLNKIEMNGVNISRANLNKGQLVNAELFYTNLNNINLSEVD